MPDTHQAKRPRPGSDSDSSTEVPVPVGRLKRWRIVESWETSSTSGSSPLTSLPPEKNTVDGAGATVADGVTPARNGVPPTPQSANCQTVTELKTDLLSKLDRDRVDLHDRCTSWAEVVNAHEHWVSAPFIKDYMLPSPPPDNELCNEPLPRPLPLEVLEKILPSTLAYTEYTYYAPKRESARSSTRARHTLVRLYGIPATEFEHLPDEPGMSVVAYPHLIVQYDTLRGIPTPAPRLAPPPPSRPPSPPPETLPLPRRVTRSMGRPAPALNKRPAPKAQPEPAPPIAAAPPPRYAVSNAFNTAAMRTNLGRLHALRDTAMELDPHTLEESEEMPVFMDSVFALTAAEGMISLVATSKRKGEYMASRRGSVPATRAGLKTLRAFLEEHVCNPRCLDSRIKYIGNWGLRCAQKSTEDSDVSTPSNGSE